jgi:hypothetical protein
MSEKVKASSELQAKLAAANGDRIPLCDDAGNVIGYALTPAQMARCDEAHKAMMAWLDRVWPPEAIAKVKERLKDETRPKRTMSEVLRLVEGS